MPRGFPVAAALVSALSALTMDASGTDEVAPQPSVVSLPPVGPAGATTLDDALKRRRSVRSFAGRALARAEIGRLLWAAQGITDAPTGGRTAPSAGALYPLEIYVVLPEGTFRYRPEVHALEAVRAGDRRRELARAALDQPSVRDAGADIVIAAVTARTAKKYGARAERYALLEAGHAAQNVLLEAVALGLGAVPIGAFDDAAIGRVVGLPPAATAVYLIPVGATAK